jgi:hypothetical protein
MASLPANRRQAAALVNSAASRRRCPAFRGKERVTPEGRILDLDRRIGEIWGMITA